MDVSYFNLSHTRTFFKIPFHPKVETCIVYNIEEIYFYI